MITPTLLLRTDRYTEGIVVAPDGTLFFSITASGVIMSLLPGETDAQIWAHVPAPNGHAIDVDGTHIVMSSAGSVIRLDPSGRAVDVIASQVNRRWLIYPNDVVCDHARSCFYFTDSGYKMMPTAEPKDAQGRVYRVEADGTTHSVAVGIAYANGLALSLDGTELYVGESVGGRIWAYAIDVLGSLGARRQFAQTPVAADNSTAPDGLTVAPDGRLLVAHYGAREVLVYGANGTLLDRMPAGNKATSHVAFDAAHRMLYISGGIEDEAGPGAIFASQWCADARPS